MTGLIYAVIVGLWAVVLVPMWLRKHDAGTETRSVDRFSTAMRSLSRREPARSREVLMPARSDRAVVYGGRAPSSAARRAEAERRAAVRRRRTALAALGGLLTVVVVAWFAGAAPLWLPLVVVLVAGGYLRYLRVEALRAQQLARRERRRRQQHVATPVRPAVADSAPVSRDSAVEPVDRPAGRRDELPDDAWDAVPVVLPTYVTAPPATSVPRKIDLTHPGSWSAARMLEHLAGRPDPDEVFDARAEHESLLDAVAPTDDELFDQTVQDELVASARPTVPPPDAVFDQEDKELFGYLDRRAAND